MYVRISKFMQFEYTFWAFRGEFEKAWPYCGLFPEDSSTGSGGEAGECAVIERLDVSYGNSKWGAGA